MTTAVDRLCAAEHFDTVVCDFLLTAQNIRALHACILFQHNVETMIWRQHAARSSHPLRRVMFEAQAQRMFRYEREVTRRARHVIAVSETDARRMQEMFDVSTVSATSTGVDLEYFAPRQAAPKDSDMVFVGSMDWMANVDGVLWFADHVLPLIRRERPTATLTIVGRAPTRSVLALAERDPQISVTGTVTDVRPYLWRSVVSVVPLRIGAGTRLKIYESMAARVPVVSTPVGAEGLAVQHAHELLLADRPEDFAAACLALLASAPTRQQISAAAWNFVSSTISWDRVADEFEEILHTHCRR